MNEEEKQITVGQRLRALTSQARLNNEARALIEVLEQEANKGNDRAYFEDLRLIVPNMIKSDALWKWLSDNEIQYAGAVSSETAAYQYTLSWQ